MLGQYPYQLPTRIIGGIKANNYQGDEPMLNDPDNLDFRPKKPSHIFDNTWSFHVRGSTDWSPLIDQGRIIPGITDGFKGFAPDIGAYEYGGEYWVPGHRNFVHVSDGEIVSEKGAKNILKVTLTLPPDEPVKVNVITENKNIKIKGDSLKFTPDNWMIAQDVTVSVNKRMGAEDRAVITFSGDDLENVEVPVRVK